METLAPLFKVAFAMAGGLGLLDLSGCAITASELIIKRAVNNIFIKKFLIEKQTYKESNIFQ
jgi:hypothetical protein